MSTIYFRRMCNTHLTFNLSNTDLLISASPLKKAILQQTVINGTAIHLIAQAKNLDLFMLYFFSVPIFNQSSLIQHPEHQESTHFSLLPTTNRNLHLPANRSHVGLYLLAYFLYLLAVHSLPSRLYTESPHSPLLVSWHK